MPQEGRARPPARPDLYVVARFLARLDNGGGPAIRLSRSRLQMAVAVNYDIFRAYLQLLLERGLVQEVVSEAGDVQIQLTDAGRGAHDQLVQWLQTLFGRDPFGP